MHDNIHQFDNFLCDDVINFSWLFWHLHCHFRYQRNSKKNKADDYLVRKPGAYSSQNLKLYFSNVSNDVDFKDDKRPLSKSIVDGSMNNCKMRFLNFAHPERIVQGLVV